MNLPAGCLRKQYNIIRNSIQGIFTCTLSTTSTTNYVLNTLFIKDTFVTGYVNCSIILSSLSR